ncbi:unnamed protein product, partial [Rotaria magnacalcarata]
MADVNDQAINQRTIRSSGAVSIGSIDYKRIWNCESVPRKFFCPICSCLLWQPHSCGSCQSSFCETCILKWTQMNSCPYGCEKYEDRRCSPQIRCQSFQYDCTSVLSYDKLEKHQISQCPYPSTICQYCERLMLVNTIEVHEQQCGQRMGSCSICNQFIPLYLLKEYQSSCNLSSIQNYLQTMNDLQNTIQPTNTYLPDMATLSTAIQFGNLFTVTSEEQKIREYYYNLAWWRRIQFLVCLILMKPFDVPQNLLVIWSTGCGIIL